MVGESLLKWSCCDSCLSLRQSEAFSPQPSFQHPISITTYLYAMDQTIVNFSCKWFTLERFLILKMFIILYLFVRVCVFTCHIILVDVRGQLVEVSSGSGIIPYGFQGLSSDHQPCWRARLANWVILFMGRKC